MPELNNRQFTAKVIEQKNVSDYCRELILEVPDSFHSLAGQYIWLEMPFEGMPQRRAFSLCHVPAKNQISIIFEPVTTGFRSALGALPAGSEVKIIGPFGADFQTSDFLQEDTVFVTQGIEAAPILNLLNQLSTESTKNKIWIVAVETQHQPLPFSEEISQLCAQHPQCELVQLPAEFSFAGVQQAAPAIANLHTLHWRIAGNQKLSDDFSSQAFAVSLPATNIYYLRFYPQIPHYLTLEQVNTTLQSAGILTQAIQNSTNHTVITDGNGKILFANKAAEQITGYSMAEMMGNTPRLWGAMMPADFYQEFWQRKKSGESFSGEFINRRKNGELYFSIAHISPLFNAEHELIGFIGTEEDITEIKIKQQALETLNTRFLLATQSAHIGVWEWDLENDILNWDDEMFLLYGYDKQTLANASATKELRRQRIHPDDFERFEANRLQAIATGSDLSDRFRILISPEEIKFIKVSATIQKNAEGKPIKMTGVNWDVTSESIVDQAKTEFVSLASHQLRTPLTSINWYTEMLLNGDAGAITPEQKGFLQEIYGSSRRMVDLVSALLNVSRIELGTFAVDPQMLNPVQIAQEALKDLQILSQKKELEIVEEHQEIPAFPLDARLIRIIYDNLLTNAIKYTPEHGKIILSHTITPDPAGDILLIKVSDTGVGIPEAEQRKIFDKLYRASNVQNIDTQGTGLGLYIVKAIITAAGGSIRFESTENKGTTFFVTLPLSGMTKKAGSKPLESN